MGRDEMMFCPFETTSTVYPITRKRVTSIATPIFSLFISRDQSKLCMERLREACYTLLADSAVVMEDGEKLELLFPCGLMLCRSSSLGRTARTDC